MRIVVVDTQNQFCTDLVSHLKARAVECLYFQEASKALSEIKKNPNVVDLVLVSKELSGGQAEGLTVAQKLRQDKSTADVPFILLSSAWGKSDFAKHQKTEFGANAYFNKSSPLTELEAMIEAVVGAALLPASGPSPSSAAKSGNIDIILEVATEVVNINEVKRDEITLSKPIDIGALISGAAQSSAAAPTSTPARAPTSAPVPPSVSAPATQAPAASVVSAPKAPVAKTPPPASVSVQVPKTASPAAVAPVPVAPKVEANSGIDIQVESKSFELEVRPERESAQAKTPEVVAPAPITIEVTTPEAPEVVEAVPSSSVVADPATQQSQSSISAALELKDVELPGPEQPISKPITAPEINVPVANSSDSQVSLSEVEAAQDLPYLFSGDKVAGVSSGAQVGVTRSVAAASSAVVTPSFDTGSNDIETLKKYLTMREQDVSVLSAQLTYAKEELAKSENAIKRMTLENEDLYHQINSFKEKIAAQSQELQYASKNREGELDQLKFEVKSKIDRIKFLEEKLQDSSDQYEKLKERVRLDIRKIRVREKELESKLEILKKDSETLIAARENKILELKRKIDLLEFNYDTLQDRNEVEKCNVLKSKEKLEKILKVLKLASGIIETDDPSAEADSNNENEKSGKSEKVA